MIVMKIILTRHGETEENLQGIFQGHLPGKLSEEGIAQAKKLALRLKDEKIDVIYSSDLARAKDTTKEIVKFHPDIPVHYVKALRERDHGSFTGKNHAETKDEKYSDNAEKAEAIQKRAKDFIDETYEKHKNETVLFVSHGTISRAIISAIRNESSDSIRHSERMKNTSVSIFEIFEDKSHKIHCLNCVKHLEQNT